MWADGEARRMGVSLSELVGTLLEWAEAEGITGDPDFALFPKKPALSAAIPRMLQGKSKGHGEVR